MVEQRTCNAKVEGSTPFSGTIIAQLAELVDAPDLGSGERSWGFESLIGHQDEEGNVEGKIRRLQALRRYREVHQGCGV